MPKADKDNEGKETRRRIRKEWNGVEWRWVIYNDTSLLGLLYPGILHNIIIKYLTKLANGFEGNADSDGNGDGDGRRRHLLFHFSLFILYHLICGTFKRFISSGHCGHIEYLSSINLRTVSHTQLRGREVERGRERERVS